MNEWYISTLSEYPCVQVCEYHHEKYDDSLLSVIVFECCHCRIYTLENYKPEFVFTKIPGINKQKYGININYVNLLTNIYNIEVTGIPWHDHGYIKKFPKAMRDHEKERILKLTDYDLANHYLLVGEDEGWEEKEIGFWLYGEIELTNSHGEVVEIFVPQSETST